MQNGDVHICLAVLEEDRVDDERKMSVGRRESTLVLCVVSGYFPPQPSSPG